MATATVSLTGSWALVSDASRFIAQSVADDNVEFIFSGAGVPGAGEGGLVIEKHSAVDSTMGSGALYGRVTAGSGDVVVVT